MENKKRISTLYQQLQWKNFIIKWASWYRFSTPEIKRHFLQKVLRWKEKCLLIRIYKYDYFINIICLLEDDFLWFSNLTTDWPISSDTPHKQKSNSASDPQYCDDYFYGCQVMCRKHNSRSINKWKCFCCEWAFWN
jgi:hypothetical protein